MFMHTISIFKTHQNGWDDFCVVKTQLTLEHRAGAPAPVKAHAQLLAPLDPATEQLTAA